MKTLKALLVTLSAVLLTGCYTQLQYSQTMHRITEERGRDYDQSEYYDEDGYYEDDYIPVYYKDYEYAELWDECGCNPYIEYNFYGGYDYWPNYYRPTHRPYYFSYYDWNPFWPSWRFHNRYFGSTFAFSFHWGSPYYHSFFYDPFYYSGFYHPFYGYRPIAYNYFYFYNPRGFYYGDNDNVIDSNRRYGPRSIGTNRVIDRSDRTRVRNRGAVINRTNSVRSRSEARPSVGTSRSRGTIDRTTGSSVRSRGHSVERSRGSNEHSSRTRSRGNLQRIDNRSIQSNNRSRSIQRDRDQQSSNIIRYRSIDPDYEGIQRIDYRNQIQKRLRNMTVPELNLDRRERSQPTFFQRLRGFFDTNNSRIINRNNRSDGRSIRMQTPSHNRPTIQRRSRSNNRSSVRSRSSSSNSRSRGTSSRSRSGGDSSNSRSRGN
ncbi:MAG TPA: hypothetical protein VF181_00545 [Balneolaceae bacterium]